jgi:4-amino-4-deoxy-L-arabinose transferase-like glycosyltransferase
MTRANAALALLAAAAAGLAVAFTWQAGLASLYDDSVFYLMMAQALSPFGQASAAVLDAAPFDTYPPFLPLLLALGGGAFDWRVAHAIVAACFGASVFLLGRHARLVTGSAALGFAAALVYACLPGAWLNVKGILSEFPYMALSFGALAFYEGTRARAPSNARGIGLGLLLAALLLTRTVGVALIAAIAACEAWRWWRDRDLRRLAQLAAIAGLPAAIALAWIVLRPSSGQDAYAEFGARVANAAAGGGLDWAVSMARANASALVDAWLNALLIFWGEWWKPKFLLAALIGMAGLGAMLWRALRAEVDGLYFAAFLAIVLAWPFPGQMFRLALPVIPLALVGALWAWQRLLARYQPDFAQRAPWAAVLPLALCVPPVVFYIYERARTPEESAVDWRKADIAEFYRVPSGPAAAANAVAQIEVFRDLARVREATPEGARVLWYSPAYVALLAERHGVRLERPADSPALAAQVRATRADYIYLANLHPRDSAHRLGHPLDPVALAEPFTRVVWRRSSQGGDLQAVLLAVDPARLPKDDPARP